LRSVLSSALHLIPRPMGCIIVAVKLWRHSFDNMSIFIGPSEPLVDDRLGRGSDEEVVKERVVFLFKQLVRYRGRVRHRQEIRISAMLD
jgi:hypothetical protein